MRLCLAGPAAPAATALALGNGDNRLAVLKFFRLGSLPITFRFHKKQALWAAVSLLGFSVVLHWGLSGAGETSLIPAPMPKCRAFLFPFPLSFSREDGDSEDEEGSVNPLVFLLRKNLEIVLCVLCCTAGTTV